MNAPASAGNAWHGPLFLIGMPRSGTKLLRSLLNRHPGIAIPDLETEFFPYWVRHWRKFGDLSDLETFRRFVHAHDGFAYFVFARRSGAPIDIDKWHAACSEYTPADVFRCLVHLHVGAAPDTVVWGDKSPSYTTQVPLLLEHFPQARFIHIFRDARDYCLSIHKAWRKNVPRAAIRWRDAMSELRRLRKQLGEGTMIEISYEELLESPEPVLRRLCAFLDVPFDPATLELAEPSENIGDARGAQSIVRSNTGKYRGQLPAPTVALIESVCGEEMRRRGYEVETRDPVFIPRWKLALYRLADGINLMRSDAREHGVIEAFQIHYSALKMAAARRLS